MPYYFKPFEIWQKKLKIYQYWCFSYFNVACFAVVPTCSSKPDDYALYIWYYFNIFPLLYYLYSSHIMSYFSSCLDYHSGEIKISFDDYLSLSRYLSLTLSVSFSLFLCMIPFISLALSLSDVVHKSRSKNEMSYSMRCLSVGFRLTRHFMAEMKYCSIAADPRLHQHEGTDAWVVCCLSAQMISSHTLHTCMESSPGFTSKCLGIWLNCLWC